MPGGFLDYGSYKLPQVDRVRCESSKFKTGRHSPSAVPDPEPPGSKPLSEPPERRNAWFRRRCPLELMERICETVSRSSADDESDSIRSGSAPSLSDP